MQACVGFVSVAPGASASSIRSSSLAIQAGEDLRSGPAWSAAHIFSERRLGQASRPEQVSPVHPGRVEGSATAAVLVPPHAPSHLGLDKTSYTDDRTVPLIVVWVRSARPSL